MADTTTRQPKGIPAGGHFALCRGWRLRVGANSTMVSRESLPRVGCPCNEISAVIDP